MALNNKSGTVTSYGDIKQKHQRDAARKIGEMGYEPSRFVKGGILVMRHPSGVEVRVHGTPSDPAYHATIREARNKLDGSHVGIANRGDQPKEEQEMATMAEQKPMTKAEARTVIMNLAETGRLHTTFNNQNVVDALNERDWKLPHWKRADETKTTGYTFVEHTLRELVQEGKLHTRMQINSGGKRGEATRVKIFSLYEIPEQQEPVAEVKPLVPVTAEKVAETFDVPPSMLSGETGADVPPAPAVDEEEAWQKAITPPPEPPLDGATPKVTPLTGLPHELVDSLRDYFMGDTQAELDELRDENAMMRGALDDAIDTLTVAKTLLSNREFVRAPKAKVAKSNIGPIREARLEKIMEATVKNGSLGAEIHYKRFATLSGLSDQDTGNALNTAARHGAWRSVDGYRVFNPRRGYYRIEA